MDNFDAAIRLAVPQNPALSEAQVGWLAACSAVLIRLGGFEGLTPAELDQIDAELREALTDAAVSVGVGALRRAEG